MRCLIHQATRTPPRKHFGRAGECGHHGSTPRVPHGRNPRSRMELCPACKTKQQCRPASRICFMVRLRLASTKLVILMPWYPSARPRLPVAMLRGDPRKVSVSKASGSARQKLGQVRRTCEGNQQEKHASRTHSAMEMPCCSGCAAAMPASPTYVKRCTKI